MSLSEQDADGVRSASDRDLVRGAGTVDQAVVVEANLRLKRETARLTTVLIWLTAVSAFLALILVALTGILVWRA